MGTAIPQTMLWRLLDSLGLPAETTLHDIRWGSEFDGTFYWDFEISGSVPFEHLKGGIAGATGYRQPAMYFPKGGSSIHGQGKAVNPTTGFSMSSKDKYRGVWPVMLTPFDAQREIDWASLKKLIDWYIAAGVHGLFTNCQSSEMFYLSDSESLQLTRFVLDYVDGRVPVVASGHTACGLAQQIDQVGRMAETGVDSVILISNRFALPHESDALALANLRALTAAVSERVGIGVYECTHPYKRLLSDEIVSWCAASGRYTFIKDTCCQIETIRRRLALVRGSRLRIANANGQTLLASLQAGCHGYSGVMTNFHPELYVWLYEN